MCLYTSIVASRILYLYDETSAHDVAMRQELEGWLYTLHREPHHTTRWHTLRPGDDLRAEREQHLKAADVILLLLSVDFIRSDGCYALACEALEQRRRGARVVPVLLRPVASWETLPFGGIQPLPRDGRPVSRWEPRDDAWQHISAEIRALLAEIDQREPPPITLRPDEIPDDDVSTPDPGERIGKYRIVGIVGRGGFGEVYEAIHEVTQKRVAIKIWSRVALTGEVEWEARATGLADHPGVVDIHDVGTLPDGRAYLVTELLVGPPLNATVNWADGTSIERALVLIWQVATTMAALHARGIAHCDLKPSNIMVVDDPLSPFGKRVKVFDFGLALLAGEESLLDPFSEGVLGTPAYMSPEQTRSVSRRELASRTDVYTLGVTFFELLTGRLPFSGGLAEMMMLKHSGVPLQLDGLSPSVPESVIDLVRRMLEHEPSARPTMVEVAASLAAARASIARD